MRVESHHFPQLGAEESIADVLLQLLTEQVDLGEEDQGVEPSRVSFLPHSLDLCLQPVVQTVESHGIDDNTNTVDLIIRCRRLVVSYRPRHHFVRQLKLGGNDVMIFIILTSP